VASRIVRALGYLTPDVSIVTVTERDFRGDAAALGRLRAWLAGATWVGGRIRVAAVRWAPGMDVGPTPVVDPRDGDSNDVVPHRDRRTLRALKVVAAWLKIPHLFPENLRDVYVGAPRRGHLEHFVVGLDGALGADSVVRADEASEALPGTGWTRLITLGLTRERVAPTQQRWLALGDIDERVDLAAFKTSPPFEPMDRCLPSDAYWAAKRVATLPRSVIDDAISAASYTDAAARDRLVRVLEARRRAIVSFALAQVTPLEVEGLNGDMLVLRDEALARGYGDAATTRYDVSFLDAEGAPLLGRRTFVAGPTGFFLPLSSVRLRQHDYLVVRVRVMRRGVAAPRAFEAHLRQSGGVLQVVGIRH
jgi:hypothetical protein